MREWTSSCFGRTRGRASPSARGTAWATGRSCSPRARSSGRSGTTGCWTRSPGSDPDRKSTRLNSSHGSISYAVFCLKKKKTNKSADALGATELMSGHGDQVRHREHAGEDEHRPRLKGEGVQGSPRDTGARQPREVLG